MHQSKANDSHVRHPHPTLLYIVAKPPLGHYNVHTADLAVGEADPALQRCVAHTS
jgi:hypothetical protein